MNEMTTATDQIRDTEIELFNMRQRSRTIADDMDATKSATVIDIENEWTRDKPIHLSNQVKRTAEVNSLLSAIPSYMALHEENMVLDEDIAHLSIDLSYLKRVERQKLSDVDMLPFASLDRIASVLERFEDMRTPVQITNG